MKYPGLAQYEQNPVRRQIQRLQDARSFLAIGSALKPGAPRSLLAQSSSRGSIVSWTMPAAGIADISGWRVYTPNESTLYKSIGDAATNSCYIEASADNGSGSSSKVNVFVSSVNTRGLESPKTQVFIQPTYEAGAPAVPSVPPGFTTSVSRTTISKGMTRNLGE